MTDRTTKVIMVFDDGSTIIWNVGDTVLSEIIAVTLAINPEYVSP